MPVARFTVERLMCAKGMRGVTRRKKVRTTVADPHAERAVDLVKRRFHADRPAELWVAEFERHEALLNRAAVEGHRPRVVAAGRVKQRAV